MDMLIDLGWAVVHADAQPGVTKELVKLEVEKTLNLIASGDYEEVVLD